MMYEGTDSVGPPMKKLICNLCGFKFSEQKYMTDHFRFCKNGKNPDERLGADTCTLKQEDCKEEFRNHSLLEEHTIKCEPIELLEIKSEEIEFTETTISERTDAGQHILKIRPPEELFNGDYQAVQPTQHHQHVETHKGVKRQSEIHISPTGNKQFKCNDCDYTGAKRAYLRQHMRTHSLEKPFKCTMCDYASADGGHLKRHLRTHTGDRPFKCTLCDYACTQSCTLTLHMRKHTGEKPYKCTQCDYASANGSHVIRHMRMHAGEKLFKCSQCDYAGVYRSALLQHMRTHTGERPYKCALCGYASTQSVHLIHHMRTHTGEKPFKCNFCNYASAERSKLTRHMRTHD